MCVWMYGINMSLLYEVWNGPAQSLSLLCLLLIVEVTPHLWPFARLNLGLETLDLWVHKQLGCWKKRILFVLMNCYLTIFVGLKQEEKFIYIQKWLNPALCLISLQWKVSVKHGRVFSALVCSLPFVPLLGSIKSTLTKGQDPASIDCAGSNHIMGDLWPLRPLQIMAWECSCGESWHSSPPGQDTISLHCKECNSIWNNNSTKPMTSFSYLFHPKRRRSGGPENKKSFFSIPTC